MAPPELEGLPVVDAEELYRLAFAEGIRPPKDLTVAEWAALERQLQPWVRFPGPWKNERTPYRVEPMEARVLRDLGPRVVVHATPVGGAGRPDEGERLLPDWEPAVEAVLDMVYRPAETRLLRDARAAGAVAIPGEEMFLTQAVAQLAEFVGRRPEEDDLRRWLP